ncbi:hypothetical protein BJX63DRAFT_427196 [Aspergillus granulosus]|uniref:Uncharacterized protein n=1 Tax=Aspergillus granulosus TaxID=176169 RepID=A0ABR4I4E7_9EURO
MLALTVRTVARTCCSAAAAVTLLSLFRGDADHEAPDWRKEISEFLSHGQLAIELLPPLPLALQRLPEGSLVLLDHVGRLLLGTVVSCTLDEVTQGERVSSWALFAPCLILVPLDRAGGGDVRDAFAIGESFGQAALLLLFLLTIREDASRGVKSVWLIVGGFLVAAVTIHNLRVVLSMLVVYIVRGARRLFERPGPHLAPASSRNGTVRYVLTVTLVLLVVVGALVLVSTLAFPTSETMYAGNYNLRHLSAGARREMRSQTSRLERPDHTQRNPLEDPNVPFALSPGTPVSIYLPHAGFLWSDLNAWDEELAVFETANEPGEEEGTAGASRRIVFKDPIGRMKPWVIQRPVTSYSPHGPISPIRNGDQLLLRDAELDGFLTAEEEPSILDRLFLGAGDPTTGRHEVSVQAAPDNGSFWTTEYDPGTDTGFRLYNPEHSCYLSSSLRNFPDWDGTFNDSRIDTVLHLELEATCTTDPTDAVSRLYIVDRSGTRTPAAAPWFNTAPTSARLWTWYSHATWAFRIYSAMWYLFRFRQQHPHWQDAAHSGYNASPSPHEELYREACSLCYWALLISLVVLAPLRLVLQRQRAMGLRNHGSPSRGLEAGRKLVAVLSFTVAGALLRCFVGMGAAHGPEGLLENVVLGVGGLSEIVKIERMLSLAR